jgi:hypothetical protein
MNKLLPTTGVGRGFEGVEVALGSARAARAEFEVAVGTAMDVVAHGPGLASGDLATPFVRISWHRYLQGSL